MSVDQDSLLLGNEPPRFDREEFNRLLMHVKAVGASDLHLQTGARVQVRRHGDIHYLTRRRLEPGDMTAICSVLYDGDNGELEIRSGKPLDNAYTLKISREDNLRFRWNGTGCEVRGGPGIKFTLRELPDMPPTLPVDDLGAELVEALYPDEGMVLVCGATGSGKSTLMAGMIRHKLEDPLARENIMEASAPIEFTYAKVLANPQCTSTITQCAVPNHLPSFAAAIPNFLRCDPDRIIIGESRDAATIKATNLAAQTGHAVYSTVHSNSVGGTFLRLMQSLPPEELASELGSLIESLRLIICQKLIPSVDGKRVAVRETLVLTKSVRNKLLSVAARNVSELPQVGNAIVDEHGTPMWRHAVKLADEGRIERAHADLMRSGAQTLASH
ncbi:type IV pilus twitching motility protein PilT [Stenotrophomonas maltophilia]|uniref:type IV pilus twitching motility protein PilT n=1 Tax=Stenotrophomonas maltophilia TaxID=40324 RepID=UPI000C158A47|nr:ATPase, T2SS/T4P/T4SS family [Stenotrophomonas maltophilia]